MGCDIHMIVERKVGKKWVAINTMSLHRTREKSFSFPLATDRNYKRFGALSDGVRGYAGLTARGVPRNASDTAKYHIKRYGSDGHSHSWMPIQQAAKIMLETEYNPDEWTRKWPIDAYFQVEERHLKEADHRLVFWFDN